jgi:hypothetical protein
MSSSVHTGTIGVTHMISPEISNELRANYSNHRVGIDFVMDNFRGAAPLPDSTLFPSGITSANGTFLFIVLGVGQYVQGKQGTTEQRQINVIDNLSVTRGSHQLKFGVDYRWLAPFSSPAAYHQFAAFAGVSGVLSSTASCRKTSRYSARTHGKSLPD